MAKKNTTHTSEKRSLTKFCAFWGIVIAVTLLIVTAIFNAVGGSLGLIGSIADLVAKIALIIAVAFPAYDYVKGKSKAWKIIFWISLVLYIVCIVLGFVLPIVL